MYPPLGGLTCAMRTEVAIVGAGPAGLLLSHLLAQDGVESIVVESRSRDYVEARIRAGILEHSTVELLDSVGLGERLRTEGHQHRGVYLQWPSERHHLDFVDLVGRSVWVYGQTDVTRDLGRAREAAGQQIVYEVTDTAVHDVQSDRPYVTFRDQDGRDVRLDADVVVGCDGSFGPSRAAVPGRSWERTYPYSWLGVLADVPPSTDELIYAWHPDGFALHSMRSDTVSRLYLQVPTDTDIADWSDERIWELPESARPAYLGSATSMEHGADAVRHMLVAGRPPTAVVAGSVQATRGVLDELLAQGVRVPDELSVVGFGDEPGWSWWGPGLTTTALPADRLANAAAIWLLHRLANPDDHAEEPTARALPCPLTVRGSTAPPPTTPAATAPPASSGERSSTTGLVPSSNLRRST